MLCFFSYHDPATPEIYTLSLHDALPIAPMAPTPTMPPMPSASARRAATERRSRTGRYSDARTGRARTAAADRKSTRLNSSHLGISYAVFCLKKKKKKKNKKQQQTKNRI